VIMELLHHRPITITGPILLPVQINNLTRQLVTQRKFMVIGFEDFDQLIDAHFENDIDFADGFFDEL